MVSYLFLADLLNMIHEEKIKSTFLFLVYQTIKIAQRRKKKKKVMLKFTPPLPSCCLPRKTVANLEAASVRVCPRLNSGWMQTHSWVHCRCVASLPPSLPPSLPVSLSLARRWFALLHRLPPAHSMSTSKIWDATVSSWTHIRSEYASGMSFGIHSRGAQSAERHTHACRCASTHTHRHTQTHSNIV